MIMTRRHFIQASASAAAAAALSTKAGAQSAKLRACIIGDTNEGGYGHGLHLILRPRQDVEVAALADPDPAGRAKHAAEAKAGRQYADYREMLEKEKPDLLVIGPRTLINHREYLLAAAEHGAHGIIEKPLAPDLAQADEIIAAVEKNKLAWAIAFNLRVNPVVEHFRKKVFEEGLVGDVLEMRSRGKEDHRAGGEDLMVLGVHVFDLMRHFVGAPQWCMASVQVGGRPAILADAREATENLGLVMGDHINAMFGFGNGVTGHFATTKDPESKGGRWGLDVHGTEGIASLRMDGVVTAACMLTRTWTGTKEPIAWQPIPGMPEDNVTPQPATRYAPIIDDMIEASKQGRIPKVSIQDGREALQMVHAIYHSHLQSARVALPLADRKHPLQA